MTLDEKLEALLEAYDNDLNLLLEEQDVEPIHVLRVLFKRGELDLSIFDNPLDEYEDDEKS